MISAGVFDECFGNVVGEGFEAFVLGDEIRFAIHFDKQAALGARLDVLGDDAFLGIAAAFFASGGDAFFAQPIDSGFHFAVRFHESFFAIHQAGSSSFAEFGHHPCCNICHSLLG